MLKSPMYPQVSSIVPPNSKKEGKTPRSVIARDGSRKGAKYSGSIGPSEYKKVPPTEQHFRFSHSWSQFSLLLLTQENRRLDSSCSQWVFPQTQKVFWK